MMEVKFNLPLLPLRDIVVFPNMVIPLFVGRAKSIKALENAMAAGKQVFLAAQHDASDDDPSPDKIYGVGTVANILQLLKLPDGTVKVLVEGVSRASIVKYVETEETFSVDTQPIEGGDLDELEAEVLIRTVTEQFERYVKLSSKIPPEVLTSLSGIDDPRRLADWSPVICISGTKRNRRFLKLVMIENVWSIYSASSSRKSICSR